MLRTLVRTQPSAIFQSSGVGAVATLSLDQAQMLGADTNSAPSAGPRQTDGQPSIGRASVPWASGLGAQRLKHQSARRVNAVVPRTTPVFLSVISEHGPMPSSFGNACTLCKPAGLTERNRGCAETHRGCPELT